MLKITKENFKECVEKYETLIIDFYADWCNPCTALSGIIERVAKNYPNVTFAKVNIDEEEELSDVNNIILTGVDGNVSLEHVYFSYRDDQKLIEDLTNFYYDEEFLKRNPNFRKRVDNDLESLRMLLKMRAADEVTHDVIIKAITANSSNASLYSALTKIQTTILQITTKIETIVIVSLNFVFPIYSII